MSRIDVLLASLTVGDNVLGFFQTQTGQPAAWPSVALLESVTVQPSSSRSAAWSSLSIGLGLAELLPAAGISEWMVSLG